MEDLIMPVLIKVKQVTNEKAKGYGKYYGHVVATKTMSYRELCKHMAEHNSVYGEDVCLGVANKLQNCLLEQLMEGKKVQFGDLGTFYLSAKSTGEASEDDFNMGTSINGLHLRFSANRQDINDLSSKTLKKRAEFKNIKELTQVDSSSSSATGGGVFIPEGGGDAG